jgi:hypothetical protein
MNTTSHTPISALRGSRRLRAGAAVFGFVVLLLLAASAGLAQTPGGPPLKPPPAPPRPVLKVYLEAPGLDPAALIKGVPYLEPVPGPDLAQVAVRISAQEVEGGREYSLQFTGMNEFAGTDNVLKTVAEKGAGPEDTIAAVSRTLQFGLMRYVARTPLAKHVRVGLLDKVSPTAVADPWNFWVFSLSLDAFIMGEKTYQGQMYFGNFSAQRVTEDLKVKMSVGTTIQKDRYDLPDYKYSSSMDSKNIRALAVKSLDDHWSLGADVTMYYSLFSNIKLGLELMPGVEFDVFPYSQSTKKQLRLLYQVGFRSRRYIEETIFDKTRETVWGQSLTSTLELKQPWGNISTTLQGFHYFHDMSKYRMELNGEISFRVFEGLNFNIDGGGSWIHDQINLAKGGATFEEVILRRKELSTTYNYFFMVGFSYSFGSIRSNVVNPRFGSSGGGGFSMHISM